jgi:HAD superfamily hydrolase (TIGR01509 family)
MDIRQLGMMERLPMQALIFDCDGVLVDTERDGHRVAFNRAFAEMGLDTTWSVYRYGVLLTTGGGKERMRRHFNETGWPVKEPDREALIQSLHRCKTDLFMGLIETGALPLRPGVVRLIDAALEAGLPVAVCSTSNERAVGAVIRVLLGPERAERIHIFAGDVVPRKKPDPAIYTLAAKTLGLTPARCLVIEDSAIGLAAAKAAGMRCLVTLSTYTGGEVFTQADCVVGNLDEGVDLDFCRSVFEKPVGCLEAQVPPDGGGRDLTRPKGP